MKNTFNINILNPDQKKKKSLDSSTPLLLFIPLFIWIIFGLSFFLFLYRPTNNEIQRQNIKLGQLNQELSSLESLKNELEKQQELYLKVSSEGVHWSSKLLSFGLIIPNNLWISKLIFTKDKNKKYLLDIYGQSFSPSKKESLDKIAQFIEGLNETSSFQKDFFPAEFIYSQLHSKDDRIVDFRLSSSVKGHKIGK